MIFATASGMKEKKGKILIPSANEATRKRDLKDIHILGPYFTWFALNEKFIAN